MMSGRLLLPSSEHPIMISLIQRVSSASVSVDGEVEGSISRGLLVFLAVQPDDQPGTTARMAQRVLTYRVFPDDDDRMNRSLVDDALELLVVPQFTLAANTAKGTRPSFTSAAPPEKGEQYFMQFLAECREQLPTVDAGQRRTGHFLAGSMMISDRLMSCDLLVPGVIFDRFCCAYACIMNIIRAPFGGF